MMERFKLRKAHYEKMREHVENLAPEEACGLVAGVDGQSVEVYPVENAMHSPVRYRMEPQGQLQAMLAVEARGWEITAIYHSHPDGTDGPSQTDIEEAAYPGVIHLIWCRKGDAWTCRGSLLDDGEVRYIEIDLIE
jgi:[CysO sulfur-carrier protein]-S-L-cysteine hydrolase